MSGRVPDSQVDDVMNSLDESLNLATPSDTLDSKSQTTSPCKTETEVPTREGLVVAKFAGHKDQVLCVDVPEASGSHLVASASEDGTCRVWDIRTRRAVKCIPASLFQGDPVNAVKFCPPNDHTLFTASGNSVYSFDLRSDSIMLKETLLQVTHSQDEINELSFRNDGKILACADDSGTVVVVDASQGQELCRLCRGGHNNICTTAKFHPRARATLASGGLDSRLVSWDFTKARALHQLDIAPSSVASGPQLVNPPFVNSLSFVPRSGSCLAAGLGDGTVALFDSYSMNEISRIEAHSAPITAVAFDCAGKGSVKPEEGLLLYTASNDATLAAWNVGLEFGAPKLNRRGKKKGKSVSQLPGNPEKADISLSFRIELDAKPNWICPLPHNPGQLFVASTSSEFCLYSGLRG